MRALHVDRNRSLYPVKHGAVGVGAIIGNALVIRIAVGIDVGRVIRIPDNRVPGREIRSKRTGGITVLEFHQQPALRLRLARQNRTDQNTKDDRIDSTHGILLFLRFWRI